jgi:flavin reductase (DIM6/NTAB) family NADH-FMN oxidoreductase RutF
MPGDAEMSKIRISTNAFIYPMPLVIVGTVVGNRANFMAAGWVSRVNYQPPLIAIAIHKGHYTTAGIAEHGQFGLSIPGRGLLEQVDYVGLVSGKEQDKSRVFQHFTRDLRYAPMIQECPLTMECSLVQAVDLPTNTLFIGEIKGAYADEQCLTDGKPDIKKMEPITLSMPDNNYWAIGAHLGKAWSIGKKYLT